MNEVDVDPAALAAEASRIADAAPADAGASSSSSSAGAGDFVPAAESWAPFMANLFPSLKFLAIPQWRVEPDQQKEICESMGAILDQIFPGGPLSGRWLPYVRLVFAAGAIAASNLDPKTGKLPPLGMKKRVLETANNTADQRPAEQPAAAADPHAPITH